MANSPDSEKAAENASCIFSSWRCCGTAGGRGDGGAGLAVRRGRAGARLDIAWRAAVLSERIWHAPFRLSLAAALLAARAQAAAPPALRPPCRAQPAGSFVFADLVFRAA